MGEVPKFSSPQVMVAQEILRKSGYAVQQDEERLRFVI